MKNLTATFIKNGEYFGTSAITGILLCLRILCKVALAINVPTLCHHYKCITCIVLDFEKCEEMIKLVVAV